MFKHASRRRAYPGGIGLKSQPAKCAGVVEVPNNGVLTEYTTKERMRAHVLSAVSAVQVPERSGGAVRKWPYRPACKWTYLAAPLMGNLAGQRNEWLVSLAFLVAAPASALAGRDDSESLP